MVCDHAWGRPMPRRYLDKAPIHAEDRSFFSVQYIFKKYGLFSYVLLSFEILRDECVVVPHVVIGQAG